MAVEYFGGPWYAFTATVISEMSASLTSVEIVEISNPIPAAQTQLLVDA